MSLTKTQIGELPPDPVDRRFSYARWNRSDKGRLPILSATSKGYRKQKAKLLWAKIQQGKLTGPGREAVERDYAKEFRRLRAKLPAPGHSPAPHPQG